MMDCLTILAQVGAAPPAEESVVPMDFFWEQVTSLGILEALTFVSFGVVCLLYGWRVFKILVVISFGMVGLGLGATLGDKIQGQNSQVWGGLIGLGLMAAVADLVRLRAHRKIYLGRRTHRCNRRRHDLLHRL
jgi:hypothetical protein